MRNHLKAAVAISLVAAPLLAIAQPPDSGADPGVKIAYLIGYSIPYVLLAIVAGAVVWAIVGRLFKRPRDKNRSRW